MTRALLIGLPLSAALWLVVYIIARSFGLVG